jgi:hypothetical protein
VTISSSSPAAAFRSRNDCPVSQILTLKQNSDANQDQKKWRKPIRNQMERSAPICYIDSSEEPNSRLIIINRRLAGYSTRKSVLYSYYSGSNKNYSLWEKKTQL